MKKFLLMVLVFLTDVYAVEKMATQKSIQEVVESNNTLKNQYEKTSKFLRLYKNSLNKIDRDILVKKELLWQKEAEACLEANPTECLNSHYLKVANSLKDEYIKSHGLVTLDGVSEKLSKNYHEVMVKEKYEVVYNNKKQENSVCLGEEHQELTKGTVLLTRFYNKVFTLFQGKSFTDKNYVENEYTEEYKHQLFIAYLLKNFSTKTLEKQIVFGLKMLNKEDKTAVLKSLKKLDEMYIYYLNHTDVTEEEIFRLNERKNVCNYVNEKNKEDFNYGHRVDVSYLGKTHVTLQLHSVVDYMYTFWHRRDMEGNLEKCRELLDFTLDFLEQKEKSTNPWKGSYVDKRENFIHGEVFNVNTLFVFMEEEQCKIVLENKDELECTIVKDVAEEDMPMDETLKKEFQTMESMLVTHKDESNTTYQHYFFRDKNGDYSFASWYFTSPTNASVRFPLKKIDKKDVNVPKFTDYFIESHYSNPNKPLIQKNFGRLYRTLLKKALKEKKPEFAGKHIIVQWGCDDGKNECTTGGVIDASTGKATEFPFKYYAHNGSKEIIYKLNSSLIIFAGDFEFKDGRTEENRVLFYEFKDGEFLFLKASEYKEKR